MQDSVSSGVHFGLTSGVITTLGLIVGLHSGTHSELAVLGGIVTIAVADGLSDALGIHIAKEAEQRHSTRHVWHATLATFVAKFGMAATFVVPVLRLAADAGDRRQHRLGAAGDRAAQPGDGSRTAPAAAAGGRRARRHRVAGGDRDPLRR
jgi:hypothetical protein